MAPWYNSSQLKAEIFTFCRFFQILYLLSLAEFNPVVAFTLIGNRNFHLEMMVLLSWWLWIGDLFEVISFLYRNIAEGKTDMTIECFCQNVVINNYIQQSANKLSVVTKLLLSSTSMSATTSTIFELASTLVRVTSIKMIKRGVSLSMRERLKPGKCMLFAKFNQVGGRFICGTPQDLRKCSSIKSVDACFAVCLPSNFVRFVSLIWKRDWSNCFPKSNS